MKPIRAAGPGGKPGRVGAEHLGSPLVGRSAPVSSRIAVVLPAPLGPMTPTIEPRSIARSTPVERDDVVERAAGAAQGGDGRGDLGRRLTGHRRSLRAGPLQA